MIKIPYLRWLTPCVLCVALLLGQLAEAAEPGRVYRFTVLHTNDLHGRFWADRDGGLGLAAQKTLIDGIRAEVRAAGGATLVLNAGDVNTGPAGCPPDVCRPQPDWLRRHGAGEP